MIDLRADPGWTRLPPDGRYHPFLRVAGDRAHEWRARSRVRARPPGVRVGRLPASRPSTCRRRFSVCAPQPPVFMRNARWRRGSRSCSNPDSVMCSSVPPPAGVSVNSTSVVGAVGVPRPAGAGHGWRRLRRARHPRGPRWGSRRCKPSIPEADSEEDRPHFVYGKRAGGRSLSTAWTAAAQCGQLQGSIG